MLSGRTCSRSARRAAVVRPLGPLGLGVVCALIGTAAQAQGLARLRRAREAAPRAGNRRSADRQGHHDRRPPRRQTRATLRPRASRKTSSPPDNSAGERQKIVKAGTDERVEAPGEAQRTGAKEMREEVQQAEANLRRWKRKPASFERIQQSTDTNEILRLRAEQEGLTSRSKKPRSSSGTVRKELQDSEMRRARPKPPGWVRPRVRFPRPGRDRRRAGGRGQGLAARHALQDARVPRLQRRRLWRRVRSAPKAPDLAVLVVLTDCDCPRAADSRLQAAREADSQMPAGS